MHINCKLFLPANKNKAFIMAHIWEQTIEIDQTLAKRLIEDQFAISISNISLLGEGFDNIAYLINSTLIFRFPRREAGVDCMHNEITLLPHIAQHVSFRFSYPEFIGKPSPEYQFPFAGYHIIDGTPLCDSTSKQISDAKFAITLAYWLKELHAVPIQQEHHAAIVGEQDWRLNVPDRVKRYKENISNYESYYNDAGFSTPSLMQAFEILSTLDFTNITKKAYLHGDLYSRHIIVDKSLQPAGLIDWGDVHIGHPGIDLAVGIMIFDEPTLRVFFDAYGNVDKETENIAIFRAFCHAMALLPYCYEKHEENLKISAKLALHNATQKILRTKE